MSWSVVMSWYAARSSRMRRRNAAGGSPAAAETSRSQWNRDRCTLDASASPLASWSSIVSARTATNRAKVSAAVEVMAAILRSPGQCPLDRGCALVVGSYGEGKCPRHNGHQRGESAAPQPVRGEVREGDCEDSRDHPEATPPERGR